MLSVGKGDRSCIIVLKKYRELLAWVRYIWPSYTYIVSHTVKDREGVLCHLWEEETDILFIYPNLCSKKKSIELYVDFPGSEKYRHKINISAGSCRRRCPVSFVVKINGHHVYLL